MAKQSRKPRDLNALASAVVDEATGSDVPEPEFVDERNPHAVALGRLGGRKGGKARAAKLTSEQRSEIARDAARKRWAATRGEK